MAESHFRTPTTLHTDANPIENAKSDFRTNSYYLNHLATSCDLPFVTCDENLLAILLESATLDQLTHATKQILFYIQIVSELKEDLDRPFNEKQLAWMALRALGFVPPSDLFNRIGDDDLIEIYDRSGIQCYRSFSFAKFTTYSLEELMFNPWHILFKRQTEINKILSENIRFALNEARQPFVPDIPVHSVTQLKRPTPATCICHH
jgi:hypothetical protein